MSKKPEWFKGVFSALVTPFAGGETVDEAAYRALILEYRFPGERYCL